MPVGNEDLLAAIYFGRSRATHHVLSIEVRLESLIGSPHAELWWADGPVQRGHAGAIRYASDARHLFGVIELDEREYGGIANATAFAYEAIANFQAQSGFPHLLRMWNYFDAINEGAGDLEQYRQFCIGRSRGLVLARWMPAPFRPRPPSVISRRRINSRYSGSPARRPERQ